jgi:hypothetical protein
MLAFNSRSCNKSKGFSPAPLPEEGRVKLHEQQQKRQPHSIPQQKEKYCEAEIMEGRGKK